MRNRAWTAACGLLAAAALLLGASAVSDGAWTKAAAWFASAAIGAGSVVLRRTFPPFLGLLLTLAAMVNTAGYVFHLWHQRTSFDEAVHGFTFFAGTASAGWFFLRRTPHLQGLYWKAALVGLMVGLAWEGFEWAIGIVGDTRDTVIDLLMDVVGALAAAALLQWTIGSHRPGKNTPANGGLKHAEG